VGGRCCRYCRGGLREKLGQKTAARAIGVHEVVVVQFMWPLGLIREGLVGDFWRPPRRPSCRI
jgi:hypothetical protein